MRDQQRDTTSPYISYHQVIAGMLAVLLLVLAGVNYLLLHQLRQAQQEQEETQLTYQLETAATFMIEPLLKHQFADVEQFMRQWVENHQDIVLFEARSPAGHLMSRFSRPTDSPHVMTRQQRVTYQERHLLDLTIRKDYQRTEKILTEIRNRLLAISLLITALLGVMLWLVFRYLAFTPLEREIAHRRQAEEEMAATNKELDAFAYSVSHDLRAPLRGIDGFSLALLEDYEKQLDDQGKDYIRRIRQGCLRMGALIDDMLQLSRLSRGEINRQPVDLSAMAHKIATELQESDPERQVEFYIEPEISAVADPTLIRAVLENLLGNAWKFTAQRRPARIEFGSQREDNRQVYFIRDNGAGFDMAYADKIFTAFQRLHKSEDFPGTGIGLATVQRIIHRHGGRIRVEAVENQGATFYFHL
ncbi:MAG: ATP-binding protein [Desulfurivibrio sp.]|nr:ATP-binding protein [Desulfurivibrio sp.]